MSRVIAGLRRLIPFGKGKGFVGYDLEGNSYYELPNPAGGRAKRTVEYRVQRDIADYTAGRRLPVQWTTWLSHTRSNPPTVQELEADFHRQSRLRPMIAAIEQRETEERIRQGYLPDPSSTGESRAGAIAGPSCQANEVTARPSASHAYPRVGNTGRAAQQTSSTAGPSETRDEPAQTFSSAAPPRRTVDPSASADELRKLAEEDTKRRIAEQGGEVPQHPAQTESAKGVNIGSGGFAPRRRGRS